MLNQERRLHAPIDRRLVPFARLGARRVVRLALLLLATAAVIPTLHRCAMAQDEVGKSSLAEYKLGPLDKIRVKVFEWRPSRDEIFAWSALNAEYIIGANGQLAFPLLGDIKAAGLSTTELSKAIGTRLQRRMGLALSPDTSVEVMTYRPFYIMGEVQKPGSFPYQPGLTVLQAISVSGGLKRPERFEHLRIEREVIASKGNMGVIARNMMVQAARRARLEAELRNDAEIKFPKALLDREKDPEAREILHQEKLIFDTRNKAYKTQLAALAHLKTFLEKEIGSLNAQIENHAREVKLVEKQERSISSLAKKGLVTESRTLELARNLMHLETSRLRLNTNLMKATQELSRTDIVVIDIRNKRQTEINDALQKVQVELGRLRQEYATQKKLLLESEFVAPRLMASAEKSRDAAPILKIVRPSAGRSIELDATENTAVFPGDTVKVLRPSDMDQGIAELGQSRISSRITQ